MPLPSPNLDDRSFRQLLDDCHARIRATRPEWTDFSPSNPGEVLLELFSHLTEVMIYRLNRLPQKAYVEFLRLMGVRLFPPAAASVLLQFRAQRPATAALQIPAGTHVTLGRTAGGQEAPVFVTAKSVTIAAGESSATVVAYHCELVEGELAGVGTGQPGQSVSARRVPIISRLEDRSDLELGVEARADELDERAPAVKFKDTAYRIWREVEDFVDLGTDGHVYVADRMTGVITFAPALYRRAQDGKSLEAPLRVLAEAPAAGRAIRLWYRRGGGPTGNVAANLLTVIKDSALGGIEVTNPEPAKGGLAGESLDNALLRGPQELHSLHRAVTARDFELLAQRQAGLVARAKAYTRATLWRHAAPGTVEVLLVPAVPDELRAAGRITPAQILGQQTENARLRIQQALDERRPLGTTCVVNWVHYKTVRVRARLIVHREENPDAVKQRVLQQLHRQINPLPSGEPGSTGWRFGQSLRASNVYDIILAEPGVNYIDRVRLLVDDVPDRDVTALAADAFQARTWHATALDAVYRSTNDGLGWEQTERFAGETVKTMQVHPARPGLLALVTEVGGENPGHRIHLSVDCGETWTMAAQTDFSVDDLAWLPAADAPRLLLATQAGLYELAVAAGSVPLQIVVDPDDIKRGFHSVVATEIRGSPAIAVAARDGGGVFLAEDFGPTASFKSIGLKGENIRVLEVQSAGPHRYLWAGVTSPGFEVGKGCHRFLLTGADVGWTAFGKGWEGGSCLRLAFRGESVLVATQHAGILSTDLARGADKAEWSTSDVNCGLPMRDVRKFQRVSALAVDAAGAWVLAGGAQGVFRSREGGKVFEPCSTREFIEQVTLPETALFCSGEHEIEIPHDDEA